MKQGIAFRRKLSRAFHELEEAGIARASYLPPLYGLLLRAGVERPPPHYLSVAQNAAYSGAWFGPLCGLLLWVVLWSRQGPPDWKALVAAFLGGLVYGVAIGLFYRASARKHRLTPWRTL